VESWRDKSVNRAGMWHIHADAHGRGFAPKGNTPVAYAPGTRKRLPMIANVTDKGYTCWLTPDYRWKF